MGTCICNPGYKGESCEEVDCMDPTCSGRGVCVRGECHCSVGWGGTNCETPRATCLDQCSGHGTFLPDTGLCSCDPSWTGHDCSIEICAADCGGHGVCVGGTCRCEDGWMGAACDQRACHQCAEHGTCRDGKCECSPGWNGEHCTIGMAGRGPGYLLWSAGHLCLSGHFRTSLGPHRMWGWGRKSFHLEALRLAFPSHRLDLNSQFGVLNLITPNFHFPGPG
uniref:EGF-like domain-containing protein n=1 Tax=Macaca fascicularis TaxID=9541 RepID=A0A2K5WSX6_MACFA